MFENRVLKRILWPEIDEVTWDWSRFYDDLHDLYFSRELKYRQVRWAGCVACMGGEEVIN